MTNMTTDDRQWLYQALGYIYQKDYKSALPILQSLEMRYPGQTLIAQKRAFCENYLGLASRPANSGQISSTWQPPYQPNLAASTPAASTPGQPGTPFLQPGQTGYYALTSKISTGLAIALTIIFILVVTNIVTLVLLLITSNRGGIVNNSGTEIVQSGQLAGTTAPPNQTPARVLKIYIDALNSGDIGTQHDLLTPELNSPLSIDPYDTYKRKCTNASGFDSREQPGTAVVTVFCQGENNPRLWTLLKVKGEWKVSTFRQQLY